MGKTRIKLIGGEEKEEKKEEKKVKTAKKKKYIAKGIFYINASSNNTILTFTDENGNVLCWSSCGSSGFKNTKKATPYAGAKATEALLEKVTSAFDVNEAKIIVKGIGPGRESAIRVLFNSNLNITSIEDRTPIPFGGPKPSRPRRV